MGCRPLGAEREFMIVPSTLAADFAQLLKVPLSVHDEMIRPGAERRGRP
jgi:hypothetical protein